MGPDKQQLEGRFASLNLEGLNGQEQVQAKEELNILASVIEEVVLKLNEGQEITSQQVQQWKKRLVPKGESELPYWYRRYPYMREVIVNLDQINRIKPLDLSEIQKITFNVEDDPQVFVKSFLQPFATCQRLIEPTQFNTEGQPINRARQGQFFVGLA